MMRVNVKTNVKCILNIF